MPKRSLNDNFRKWRNDSARSWYCSAISREWVKRTHPDIWAKIVKLADKRYPREPGKPSKARRAFLDATTI
jgi:hypothetical protein